MSLEGTSSAGDVGACWIEFKSQDSPATVTAPVTDETRSKTLGARRSKPRVADHAVLSESRVLLARQMAASAFTKRSDYTVNANALIVQQEGTHDSKETKKPSLADMLARTPKCSNAWTGFHREIFHKQYTAREEYEQLCKVLEEQQCVVLSTGRRWVCTLRRCNWPSCVTYQKSGGRDPVSFEKLEDFRAHYQAEACCDLKIRCREDPAVTCKGYWRTERAFAEHVREVHGTPVVSKPFFETPIVKGDGDQNVQNEQNGQNNSTAHVPNARDVADKSTSNVSDSASEKLNNPLEEQQVPEPDSKPAESGHEQQMIEKLQQQISAQEEKIFDLRLDVEMQATRARLEISHEVTQFFGEMLENQMSFTAIYTNMSEMLRMHNAELKEEVGDYRNILSQQAELLKRLFVELKGKNITTEIQYTDFDVFLEPSQKTVDRERREKMQADLVAFEKRGGAPDREPLQTIYHATKPTVPQARTSKRAFSPKHDEVPSKKREESEEEKGHFCPHCGEQFADDPNVLMHISNAHSSVKVAQCTACEETMMVTAVDKHWQDRHGNLRNLFNTQTFSDELRSFLPEATSGDRTMPADILLALSRVRNSGADARQRFYAINHIKKDWVLRKPLFE